MRSFARFLEEIGFLIGSFFLLKGKFEFFNQRNGELFHFLSSFFASPCVSPMIELVSVLGSKDSVAYLGGVNLIIRCALFLVA